MAGGLIDVLIVQMADDDLEDLKRRALADHIESQLLLGHSFASDE